LDPIIINAIVGTGVQVGLAGLVCIATWVVFGRRRSSPSDWLGLIKAPPAIVVLAFAAGVLAAVGLLQISGLPELASGPGTVIYAVAGGRSDGAALIALALVALVKTAFAEEMVFRGLIAKRLYGRIGFWGGNGVQAALFAAIHLPILLLPEAQGVIGVGMVGFAGLISLAAGWLNERRGNGSILPGVGLHAGANLTTYLMLAIF
jgi:uncharacterized protein